MKMRSKVISASKFVNAPIIGTNALNPQNDIEYVEAKAKVLKKVYVKPKSKIVEMSTQKSPVMGCWDCGEDGIHC